MNGSNANGSGRVVVFYSLCVCLGFLAFTQLSSWKRSNSNLIANSSQRKECNYPVTNANATTQQRHILKGRNDFSTGTLNVKNVKTSMTTVKQGRCVSIRFRGHNSNDYSVDEAIQLMIQKYFLPSAAPGPREVRVGIVLTEWMDIFNPLSGKKRDEYHLFHFMELIVIAYSELQRLSRTLPLYPSSTVSNDGKRTLSQGSPLLPVVWLYVPGMSAYEICGSHGINCFIADMVFQGSNSSIFSSGDKIIGGKDTIVGGSTTTVDDAILSAGDSAIPANVAKLFEDADLLLMVERFSCDSGGINQPWSKYTDSFPVAHWQTDVATAVGPEDRYTVVSSEEEKPLLERPVKKLVVCYLDRQNTFRAMPDEFHVWVVQLLSTHDRVTFQHLHMEEYSAMRQIEIASTCDMLLGVHGNGLTHALWMRPAKYMVELWFRTPFAYDYVSIAQMMRHSYIGIYNGRPLDQELIKERDPRLFVHPFDQTEDEVKELFETHGKKAIEAFVNEAADALGVP